MNFLNYLRRGFRMLLSDRHTDIERERERERERKRETDRRTESTKIINHAASGMVNNNIYCSSSSNADLT